MRILGFKLLKLSSELCLLIIVCYISVGGTSLQYSGATSSVSGELAVVSNFQDLCFDHVFLRNLNVVVFLQDSILHIEQLHYLLNLQWHGVLGHRTQFTWSAIVRCSSQYICNDLLARQDVFHIHISGGRSAKFKNIVSVIVWYTKFINLEPVLGIFWMDQFFSEEGIKCKHLRKCLLMFVSRSSWQKASLSSINGARSICCDGVLAFVDCLPGGNFIWKSTENWGFYPPSLLRGQCLCRH